MPRIVRVNLDVSYIRACTVERPITNARKLKLSEPVNINLKTQYFTRDKNYCMVGQNFRSLKGSHELQYVSKSRIV